VADVVDVVYLNMYCNLICGVPWGGWSSKRRTGDCKPGTGVDGNSHHELEKLVLQVSKRGIGKYGREQDDGGEKQGEGLTWNCYMPAYLYIYVRATKCYLRITLFGFKLKINHA
jgi:hypothetical protein